MPQTSVFKLFWYNLWHAIPGQTSPSLPPGHAWHVHQVDHGTIWWLLMLTFNITTHPAPFDMIGQVQPHLYYYHDSPGMSPSQAVGPHFGSKLFNVFITRLLNPLDIRGRVKPHPHYYQDRPDLSPSWALGSSVGC